MGVAVGQNPFDLILGEGRITVDGSAIFQFELGLPAARTSTLIEHNVAIIICVVSLAAYLGGMSQLDAARSLADMLGVTSYE